jgi:hypothetical protein
VARRLSGVRPAKISLIAVGVLSLLAERPLLGAAVAALAAVALAHKRLLGRPAGV